MFTEKDRDNVHTIYIGLPHSGKDRGRERSAWGGGGGGGGDGVGVVGSVGEGGRGKRL